MASTSTSARGARIGNRSIGEFLMAQRAFIALLVLIVIFTSLSDSFLTATNLVTMTKHVAYNALLSLGMLLVILTGGIDLSIGSIVGLSGVIAGVMLKGVHLSLFDVNAYPSVLVVVIIALILGTAVGTVNGILITRFNVAPFIATLGTMYMARGVALLISKGATYPDLGGEEAFGNTGFSFLGVSRPLGLPTSVWLMIIFAAVVALVVARAPFGRWLYAVGGNERAAELSGVPVNRVKMRVYMVSGFFAGPGGPHHLLRAHRRRPGRRRDLRDERHRRRRHRRGLPGRRARGCQGRPHRLPQRRPGPGGRVLLLADLPQGPGHRPGRHARPGPAAARALPRRGPGRPERQTGSGPHRRRGSGGLGPRRRGPGPISAQKENTTMPSTLLMPRRTLLRAGALGALGLSLMGSAGCSSRSSGSNYIAIITPAHDNPFFKTQAEAAVAAATAMGYTANSFSHGDDVNKQSELFDSAISQGAAAIICDNAGADSTEGAVRKAVEVGIPVFLIDREINASGLATAQIVANNSQGAALVAAKLADTLQGKGRYYELLGRETDTNAQVRSTAFHSVLDQYPGFELVATETANWDQQIGYQKVETLLQRDANVQAIICGNDTMAVGAVAAVQQAGKTGDILVIGFDGSPDAVKTIQGGSMLATGMQPAVDIAKMAVEQADAYIKNGETGKKEKQLVDCVLIDKSNADRYTLFEMKES